MTEKFISFKYIFLDIWYHISTVGHRFLFNINKALINILYYQYIPVIMMMVNIDYKLSVKGVNINNEILALHA
jgi:hypothetical protein